MKKYLVVTNVWGKKAKSFWNMVDVFKEEREYFDTKEEVDEYVGLFEAIGKTYEVPEVVKVKADRIFPAKTCYNFNSPNEKAWGYVVGDTETCTVLKWGGLAMYNISKKDDGRLVKDYLFRGKNEIPKNYKWDEGEYEGWLQYRWGDGKNAVGYVENEEAKPVDKKPSVIPMEIDADEAFAEAIEDKYAELESKDLIKRLEDRW